MSVLCNILFNIFGVGVKKTPTTAVTPDTSKTPTAAVTPDTSKTHTAADVTPTTADTPATTESIMLLYSEDEESDDENDNDSDQSDAYIDVKADKAATTTPKQNKRKTKQPEPTMLINSEDEESDDEKDNGSDQSDAYIDVKADKVYCTPRNLIEILVEHLEQTYGNIYDLKNSDFYECAAGYGNIVNCFREKGYRIRGTDKYHKFEGNETIDFLELPNLNTEEFIITNPPFHLMQEFLHKCIFFGNNFAILGQIRCIGTQYFKKLFHDFGIDVLVMTKHGIFVHDGGELDVGVCVWLIKTNYSAGNLFII